MTNAGEPDQALNATETDRMASVAANSPVLALRDTPTPDRPSDPLSSTEWLAHWGNVPLARALVSPAADERA